MNQQDCCILNGGSGAWAFESLAKQLSTLLKVDLSQTPRRFNYLLYTDNLNSISCGKFFIPVACMRLASDKRLLAEVFAKSNVPIPETYLLGSKSALQEFLSERNEITWCLKYPTSCGGSGHRLLDKKIQLHKDWPNPLLVQEFICQQQPEVYRIYCANSELFGWVVRRFPENSKSSPWVAHANGAKYERAGNAPYDAMSAAKSALEATGLIEFFGCVDLIQRPSGEWLVLEVGTDGIFNYVDRDIGLEEIEQEIAQRTADAFWEKAAINRSSVVSE